MIIKILKIISAIIIEIILISGFLLSSFATINTMVSIKYETEFGDGCISYNSGYNLCLIKALWIISALVCFILSIGWLSYIIRKSKEKNVSK